MTNERYNEVANRLISTRASVDDPKVNLIVTGADSVYDDVAPYRINGHIDCTAVTPVGTENPVELRWYERVNYNTEQEPLYDWIRSQDTTVDNQKTYGIPNGAKQSDINDQLYEMVGDIDKVVLYANEYEQITSYPSGANPQANGWYTESGGVYTQTTDTTVIEAHKPYYARVAHISPDENKITDQQDGYIPTAGAVGRALGANFEDNLQSTSKVKGLSANMGRVLNETKANKNGWYEQLVAGASLSVIGDDTDDKAKFFYRETGDSEDTGGTKHTIEKGTATIDKIEGNTVKWNQLLHIIQKSSTTENNVTYTVNATGITIQTTNEGASANTLILLNNTSNYLQLVYGHKYYLHFNNSVGSNVRISERAITAGFNGKYESIIITASGGGNQVLGILVVQGTIITTAITINPYIIDLTLLGIDNLTTTVEVEAWLALNVGYQDYYPYNAGSLISLKPKKLVSTGFNLWDEKLEVGGISSTTGENETDNYAWRSVNYIPVFPGMPLYFRGPSALNTKYVRFRAYDKDKQFIGSAHAGEGNVIWNDTIAIVPANCYYIRFGTTGGTYPSPTYNNDICVNFSSSKNGDYKPYIRPTEVDLSWIMDIPDPNDSSKKLFPYGLLRVGSVRDEVRGNKVIKRVGCVDLGTLTWSKSVSNPNYPERNAYEGAVQGIFIPSSQSQRRDGIVSIKFGVSAGTGPIDLSYGGNSLGIDNTMATAIGKIFIRCDEYNSVDAFKTAMNGVMLYYELATPIEVTFEEPDTHPMNYEVEPGGNEEFVKADAALGENEPTSTPFTATITYPMDTLQTIRNLETNLATLKSNYRTTIGNLASTLSTALGGTFTATESTEGSGLYTFSYAAPASGFLAAGNGANGTWSVDNNTMLLTPVSNSNSSENESI